MCEGIPAPFSARGDAKNVGRTLVNQGLAFEVSRADAKRGDFVVYEYGTYGHIGVLLSGNRLFQQNAQVAGVARRLVDGAYVYASTIVTVYNSLGGVAPKFYRIKAYIENIQKEVIAMPNRTEVQSAFDQYSVGQPTEQQLGYYSARGWNVLLDDILIYVSNREKANDANQNRSIADLQAQVAQIPTLQAKNVELSTKAEALAKTNDTVLAENKKLVAQSKKYEDQANADMEQSSTILRRLGQWLAKFLPTNNNKES